MHTARFTIPVAAAAALLVTVAPLAQPVTAGSTQPNTDDNPVRLAVGDADSGAVAFVDAASGDVVGTLDATGPAYLTSDGRIVYATDPDGDAVTLMDGGSWEQPHGDHVDVVVEDPSVLGVLEGPRPVHVVPNDGYTTVFFDDAGRADVFPADSLNEGDLTPELVVETSLPHHGVVVLVDNDLVVSVPGPTEEDLPVGVEVRSSEGEVEASFPDCPDMHGEAPFEDSVLFACADGVQVVRSATSGWESVKIAYPEGTPSGDRTWSFVHDHESSVVAGVLGESAVLLLDRAFGEAARVELPAPVVTTAIAEDGLAVLALTADGELHRIDVATREVAAHGPVVGPIDLEGDGPQPVIVVVDDVAYVTDGVGAVVPVAFADAITAGAPYPLGFAPGDMVVVGE